MKIDDRDMDAIKALGYNEAQARFLYIVATHSGYFVPRQFINQISAHWGSVTQQFAKKLQSRGHATWREYPGIGSVFHLSSKKLYAEIGKDHIRSHRQHALGF